MELHDRYVGDIATLSMGASLLFLFVQILIPFPFLLITLVATQMGWIDSEKTQIVGLITVGLIELSSIGFLVRFIRRRIPKDPCHYTELEIAQATENHSGKAFTERQLEIAIAVLAFVPIWYLSSSDHNVLPVKIILLVVESFGVLFMTIFIVTRWILTRELRAFGVTGLLCTIASVWFLLEDLKR